MKSVKLIYQDCATCKLGLAWSEILAKANELGFSEVIATPYYTKGVKEVIKKAKKQGYTMPFFTDDENFGDTLMDLVEKTAKTTTKSAKTAKKSQKSSGLPEKVAEKGENGAEE